MSAGVVCVSEVGGGDDRGCVGCSCVGVGYCAGGGGVEGALAVRRGEVSC